MKFNSLFLASIFLRVVYSQTPYSVNGPPLSTRWTNEVGTNPWPSHPRPQMFRESWKTLNGLWQFKPTDAAGLDSPPNGQTLDREILVPSCIESGLSGIGEDHEYSWWKTTFETPGDWDTGKTLLNFGAVDYEGQLFQRDF